MTQQHPQITRALEIADLVIERSGSGRMVHAKALTYGVPYEVTDDGGRSFYHEVWRAGVFDKSIRQGSGKIPILVTHNRMSPPVGVFAGVDPDAKAFVFRARISNTQGGDDALTLIEDGALSGVSVGASIFNNRAFRGGVERVEARVNEISLTPFAQMNDGVILAVRATITDPDLDEPAVDSETNGDEVETPALDEARKYLESLERP